MNIPTKYIHLETGLGLLAVTIALSGAAIIPRWNTQVEYCVPRTDCRITKAVDPELFQWHQAQALATAEKLKQKELARAKIKRKPTKWGATIANISDTWEDTSDLVDEAVIGAKNTFSPKSSKEFLRLTAEARRKGWQLEAVQELPGYADWRQVAGGLSFVTVSAAAWLMGQLEVLQLKRDRREELDEQFALEKHQKALTGEAKVVHAEIEWQTSSDQKALDQYYMGDAYEDYVDAEMRAIDGDINRLEVMQNQLTGNTLDQTNDPSDKINYKTEPKFAIGASETAKKLDKSEDTVWRILFSVISSRLSSLLIGTTGAGKSVFQCAWIIELARKSPDLEIYAVVQKQDYPVVIPDNRVAYFDQDDPTAALFQIATVWGIYDKRRRNLRSYKAEDKLTPVKLILGDWLSVAAALSDLNNVEAVKASKWLSRVRDIALNGRATNVSLIADLQSFNIEALGIKADVNIRKNFNIFGLGNYSIDDDGTVNDSYGVLENMIANHYLVPDEELRALLKAEYKKLKSTSRSNNRPIMFCSLDPMTVCLMPDLRHYENHKLSAGSGENLTDVRARLEGLLQKEDSAHTPAQPEQTTQKLSPVAQKILKWLKQNRAVGVWLKYKGKEGRDGNFINFLSDIGADWKTRDAAIQELATAKLIEVDDEKGMRLIEVSGD